MRKLSLLMIMSVIFIFSCHQQTPDDWNSCDTDSDCGNPGILCLGGQCHPDPCSSMNCGKGECVRGLCECSENAVFAEEYQKCVPTCHGYSEECTNFGVSINRCHMGLGRCDISCQGEGSCKEGWYCSTGGACRKRDN